MTTTNTVPEGFKKDAKGNLVAIQNIRPIDLLRDELVYKLTAAATEQKTQLKAFKEGMRKQFDDFVSLSALEYDVKMGGKKGNISLVSFDGKLKVQLSIADYIQFDERLQVAKALIDECIHDWALDANSRIRILIEHAFRVDKQGQVSTSEVLSLRKLDMHDARWDKAMQAISDSIQVMGSKEYIRFYNRSDADQKWQPIVLDLAAL